MMIILSDTHTHLYDEAFAGETDAVFTRAQHNRVRRFFIPNVDRTTAAALVELCKTREGVYGMMGVHPCSVKADYKEELAHAEKWLGAFDFVAIGEIGLDLYWDKTFLAEQIDALETQLHWSMDKNLPVAIHCRDAFDPIWEVLSKPEFNAVRGIFHCFSGTEEQAHKLTDKGWYLGIGGVLTFRNSGLDKAIASVPLEQLVLETDAPYLAPVPFRGKRNEPSYLLHIAEKLAEVKGVSLAEVAEISTRNSEKIFGV